MGAIVGGIAPALALASIVVGSPHSAFSPTAGTAFGLAAGAVAILNAYLSFVRPRLVKLGGLRHVSGLPAIGTALVVVSLLLAFGDRYVAVGALVAMVIDTGGIPDCIATLWADDSFWKG